MCDYLFIVSWAWYGTVGRLTIRATSRRQGSVHAFDLSRALSVEYQAVVYIKVVRKMLLKLVLHLQVPIQHILLHRVPLLIRSPLLSTHRWLWLLCSKVELQNGHLCILVAWRFIIFDLLFLSLTSLVRWSGTRLVLVSLRTLLKVLHLGSCGRGVACFTRPLDSLCIRRRHPLVFCCFFAWWSFLLRTFSSFCWNHNIVKQHLLILLREPVALCSASIRCIIPTMLRPFRIARSIIRLILGWLLTRRNCLFFRADGSTLRSANIWSSLLHLWLPLLRASSGLLLHIGILLILNLIVLSANLLLVGTSNYCWFAFLSRDLRRSRPASLPLFDFWRTFSSFSGRLLLILALASALVCLIRWIDLILMTWTRWMRPASL